MKPTNLTLLSFLLLSVLTVAVSHRKLPPPPPPGAWTPLKDFNDPHVKEIAKFAVSEHNKISKTRLKFKKVNTGESQVISGTNYRLVISVSGGEPKGTKKYLVVVSEKPEEDYRKLKAFKPLLL